MPCVTTLFIFITLRKLIITVENGRTTLIFDSIPETKFWVASISFLLLGTIIATDILFQYFVQYNEENRKRIFLENQVIQTKKEVTEIENIYSDMRGLRHDMQNHINSIMLYVKNNLKENYGEIEKYIGKMGNTISKLDFSYHCGNPIIDIIIHQAMQKSKNEGIEFEIDFVYPCHNNNKTIDVYDMAVILNNALENAFEACKKVTGKKAISLHSYIKGNLYFIEVENTFAGQISFNKNTGLPKSHKTDKKMHGIGLSNIQKCAKKYLGDVDIEITSKNDNQRFSLTVMMNISAC